MWEEIKNVKVRIVDIEFLKTISPKKVRQYLMYQGWEVVEKRYLRDELIGFVWYKKGTYKNPYLMFKNLYTDYPARLSELLDVLMEVENRSQLLIVQDILNIKE